MIKYYKFNDEYQEHTEDEAQDLASPKSSLGDPNYYEAFRLMDCEPDKLCIMNNEDLTREEWDNLYEYINNHSVNEPVNHADWTSGFPYYGLTNQYYIHTDKDNYYNVVYGYDFGFEWVYVSEDFIEEYKELINSEAILADQRVDFICD